MTETELSAERVARNNALFRDANEGINEAARRYGVDEGLPFICECPDPTCTEILRLQIPEYEAIRANPAYFINAPGHLAAAQGSEEVVEHRNGYDLVRKVGRAAALWEDRQGDGRA